MSTAPPTPALPSPALPGRVAGIDYGTVRIGIAVSDPARTLSSPCATYARAGPDRDARYFRQFAAEERITLFVVGLPVHLDGRESEKSAEARQFGRWLADVTGVPVELFDERFTSRQAEDLLLDAGMTRKRRKGRLDKVAAQVLLAAYLESQARGSQPPGPLDD
jgi:putative Holliday junction resolvase